jgi:hypothetical protein
MTGHILMGVEIRPRGRSSRAQPPFGLPGLLYRSSAVFRVLTEIAPEIPVALDTAEKQGRIRDLLDGACASQTSWVALDGSDSVVGFLVGQTYSTDMPGMEFSGVELLYGGVLKAHRCHGRFSNLLAEAKAVGTPLRAVVKHANTSAMAARLVTGGFVKRGASLRPDEDTFVWTPPENL